MHIGQDPHTRQNENKKSNQCRVSHVKNRSGQAAKADPCRPEDERIEKHVASRHPGSDEGAPLPPVVLCAQQEVHQEDGGSCRSNNHQAVAQEQESKHVIDFVGPERGHDEVELNKDSPEGKDTRQQEGRDRPEGTGHRRNLTWDLICFGRSFNSLCPMESVGNPKGTQ